MASFGAKLRNFFWCDSERGTWPGRLDFIFSALSYTLGLGVIWRFPYFQYRNGGDIFLLPYIFFVVLIGLPLVFLEISLGQFTNFGPIKCWGFAPVIQGVGLSMVVLSGIVAIYHNIITATVFYYLFASFTSKLPWTECGKEWRTKPCLQDIAKVSSREECYVQGWSSDDNGGCFDDKYNLQAIWNSSGSVLSSHGKLYNALQTFEYLHRQVWRDAYSEGLDDLGPVVWHMALCSLFVWIIIALCLNKSVRVYGKIAYFTTLCPLCILIVLFIYGLTLNGHAEGYRYYRTPDRKKLDEYRNWKDAAVHVFYSLNLSFGGLVTLSSYNTFNSDTIRNSTLLCFIHVITSVIGGSMLFFFIGAFAKYNDTPVENVASAGPELAFSVMPAAFTMTNAPTFWSILWFVMLANLAIGSQLGYVETVITAILDVVPSIRCFRVFVVCGVCCLFFLLGLPMTTQGGFHMIGWLDIETATWNLLLLPLLELVALHIYGVPRFLNDVEIMIGRSTFWCIPTVIGKLVMGFFLFLPTLGGIIFMNVVIRMDVWTSDWPGWAVRLGKTIKWSTPVFIILGALFSIIQARSRLRMEPFAFMFPSSNWGPVLAENRAKVLRYVPWFRVSKPEDNVCMMQETETMAVDDITVVVAETTQTSMGVGYEIGRAMEMKKRILCLFRPGMNKKLSLMISGAQANNSNIAVRQYNVEEEAFQIVKEFFKAASK